MKFYKYQSLGNCYVVISPEEWKSTKIESIALMSDARWGIGFDGIIIGPWIEKDSYGIRIYNKDCSECLLSGNALRIFSYHLKKTGVTSETLIPLKMVKTEMRITTKFLPNENIEVQIGKFSNDMSPFVNDQTLNIDGIIYNFDSETYEASGINLSNPHMIVNGIPEGDRDKIIKVGEFICKDKIFTNKTNVHFVKIKDRKNIYVESWERGAGYTLSSSNGAGAAVAHYYINNLLDNEVTVIMPGGELIVKIDEEQNLSLTGKVENILEGILYE